jgi:uncharacterized protein YggE
MKRALGVLLLVAAACGAARAQASGNVGYAQGGGSNRAEQNERAKRVLGERDVPPSATSMFVEASVLMNVRADEHVAVFGVAQECATVPECNQKMDATVAQFAGELRQLGIKDEEVFVDFAAQNKIYGFQIEGSVARERLSGFELKKNVSVRYRERLLLDKLIIAASRARIFDLIKVDYVVRDAAAVQNRLMEEAARVVREKAARYERLLGVKLQQPAQVYAERPSIYYPTEMYDSYAAFESEEIDASQFRGKYTVHGARKSRTFFFNALTADGFDAVVNPVVLEPVVQFTLYLKVKHEIEGAKGK